VIPSAPNNSTALLDVNLAAHPQTVWISLRRDERDTATHGLPWKHLLAIEVGVNSGGEVILFNLVSRAIAGVRWSLPSTLLRREKGDLGFHIG